MLAPLNFRVRTRKPDTRDACRVNCGRSRSVRVV
nr:MAG TPA_asm: hypothetical protein [Bacteriophage sp.]